MLLMSKNMCSKKTKNINVKVFNVITNKNEAKTMAKHILCDCKCIFSRTTCNSNQKWNNETCQCECKNYCICKKGYSWNPRTCICQNGKYLTSKMKLNVMDIASTKLTNTIAANATSTVSINCHSKKVRYTIDCYILHSVLLVIILLLIITITCNHYAKHRSKQKSIDPLTI